MPRPTTFANCMRTLSVAQKTPKAARPRPETQSDRGNASGPEPAMHGSDAATPCVTHYFATAPPASGKLRAVQEWPLWGLLGSAPDQPCAPVRSPAEKPV